MQEENVKFIRFSILYKKDLVFLCKLLHWVSGRVWQSWQGLAGTLWDAVSVSVGRSGVG